MPTAFELVAQLAARTDLDQPIGRAWLADTALANPTLRNVLLPFAFRAQPCGGLPNTIPLDGRGLFDLYLVYVFLYGKAPAWDALVAGDRVLLGLRVPSSTKAGAGGGEYDDLFVVLHNDLTAKTRTADEFEGNTEPSWRYDAKKNWTTNAKTGKVTKTANAKALGQDVDGDGVADLGRIPTGTFKFVKSTSAKLGNILKPSAAITLERDSNHDGTFDSGDTVKKGLEGKLKAGDTYFHKGGTTITGSAGCQTLKPATFGQFWKALGTQNGFQYVLVAVV